MTTSQQVIDTILPALQANPAVDLLLRWRPWVSTPAQDTKHINLFVVPKPGQSFEFSLMHFLGEIKVQLTPTTWEAIETYHATHHIGASQFTLSTLLFAASEESRQRYETLKNNLTQSTPAPQVTLENLTAAQKYLTQAKQCFADYHLHGNKLNAAIILDTLCDVLCTLNQAHPRQGAANIIEEMQRFPHLPDHFIHDFAAVMHDPSLPTCKTLLQSVDNFVKKHEHTLTPNFLPGWYEMWSEGADAIATHCDNNDPQAAYLAAMQIQYWLTLIEKNQNNSLPADLQLIHQFNPNDLPAFKAQTEQARQAFIKFLHDHNIPLQQITSLENLRKVLHT